MVITRKKNFISFLKTKSQFQLLGSSFASQLPALGDLANDVAETYAAIAEVNALINATGNANRLTTGISDVASALEAVSKTIWGVTAAIGSCESLCDVNASFKIWSKAETVVTAAFRGISDGSGSPGCARDLIDYAISLQDLSVALLGLTSVLRDLPCDSVVGFGKAAICYGLTDSIDKLGVLSILAATIDAVIDSSDNAAELKSVSSALKESTAAGAVLNLVFRSAANK